MTRAEYDQRALERFRGTENERRQVNVSLAAGRTPVEIDSPKRAEQHLQYIGATMSSAEVVREAEAERRRGETPNLERIIGRDNLQSVLFLTKGAARARAVGVIGARDNFFGTGFLIAPGILLTNNHVLGDEATAAASFVAFNFEDTLEGQVGPEHRFELRPQNLFLTSPELDYTVVAVAPVTDEGKELLDFGYIPLTSTQGKALLGEPLNVIQHPNGGRKQVAIRENRFTAILDDYLHYETDTNPGSSGSPVFNDMWDVVALHHSVVPQRDDRGQFMGNEGVRISVILRDLWQRADAAAQGVMRDFIPPASPADAWRGKESPPSGSRTRRPDSQVHRTVFELEIPGAAGAAVRVPLTVTIEVAAPRADRAADVRAVELDDANLAGDADALPGGWRFPRDHRERLGNGVASPPPLSARVGRPR